MIRILPRKTLRRLLHALRRAAFAAALIAATVAHARAADPGPRLRLPEASGVRPGELLAFHWDRPDPEISELEILLSLDGGRHYTRCVSPQLDPRTGEYHWRVPDLGVARMRFRIRYHRDGREIEGEPSALVCVQVQPPDPIDLPAPPETEAAGGSREGKASDASSAARATGQLCGNDRDPERDSRKFAPVLPGCFPGSPASDRPLSDRVIAGESSPVFVPPRK